MAYNKQVKGYSPDEAGIKECLTGAEIVLIPAGVPRKPGMTRDGNIIYIYWREYEEDQLT
jgi:malate/lactate dehydrogenase